jgi:hypothetical protein
MIAIKATLRTGASTYSHAKVIQAATILVPRRGTFMVR